MPSRSRRSGSSRTRVRRRAAARARSHRSGARCPARASAGAATSAAGPARRAARSPSRAPVTAPPARTRARRSGVRSASRPAERISASERAPGPRRARTARGPPPGAAPRPGARAAGPPRRACRAAGPQADAQGEERGGPDGRRPRDRHAHGSTRAIRRITRTPTTCSPPATRSRTRPGSVPERARQRPRRGGLGRQARDRRERGDEPGGQAGLGGRAAELAREARPLLEPRADVAQGTREVAAGAPLDQDRGDHDPEVTVRQAGRHGLERLVEARAHRELGDEPAELGGRWLGRVAGRALESPGATRVRRRSAACEQVGHAGQLASDARRGSARRPSPGRRAPRTGPRPRRPAPASGRRRRPQARRAATSAAPADQGDERVGAQRDARPRQPARETPARRATRQGHAPRRRARGRGARAPARARRGQPRPPPRRAGPAPAPRSRPRRQGGVRARPPRRHGPLLGLASNRPSITSPRRPVTRQRTSGRDRGPSSPRTTAATSTTRRRPSAPRAWWTTRSTALATCSATARCGRSTSPMRARVDQAPQGVLGRRGVQRRERALVTGGQGLHQVEGLAAADLPHHDAVRSHAERVAHEGPDGHRAATLEARRAALQAHDVRQTRAGARPRPRW